MSAYTTLADCHTFLSIPSSDTSEDSLLTLLISTVSAAIDADVKQPLGSASYSEYYVGTNRNLLVLKKRPVTAIASIYYDESAYWNSVAGSFSSATQLVNGTDYALVVDQPDGTTSRCGLVKRINDVWEAPNAFFRNTISPSVGFQGNLLVNYTAGWVTIPAEIELAALLTISAIRRMAQFGTALTSYHYEEFGITLANMPTDSLFPKQAQMILAKYRNVIVG